MAAGLLVGASAQAGVTTYDFQEYAKDLATKGEVSIHNEGLTAFKLGSVQMYYAQDATDATLGSFAFDSRFAIQNGDIKFRRGGGTKGQADGQAGIQNTNNARYFSILGLSEGDKVTINVTDNGNGGLKFYSTNVDTNPAQWDALTSGTAYTISSGDRLDLQLQKLAIITSISIESENETVTPPTLAITKVSGTTRVLTMTPGTTDITSNTVKVYYTTDNTTPTTSSNEYKEEITVEEPTTYTAVTISSSGKVSESVTLTVNAGTVITLPTPNLAVSGINEANGGYYPIITITQSNDVEGKPVIDLAYDLDGTDVTSNIKDGKYAFESKGTLTVTASADGYESNSSSYTVNGVRAKIETINIAGLTEEGVNTTYWTKNNNETTETQWKFNNAVNYSLASEDYVKTAIEGITLWWDEARKPMLYVGKGLMLPYGDGKVNNKDVSYTNGTEDQLVIWTYLNSYGASTKTAITTGNQPYSLYRFSDMLSKVEVYSPYVSTTIGETGYATISSTAALDLANLSGSATAYYASSVEDGYVVLKEATGTVAAGEGLILAGEGTVTIPVATTSGTAISGNLLVGCPTGETLTENANQYVLVANGETAEFQSLAGNGATIPAGKAYLDAEKTAGARLSIIFDGETTGIAEVATAGTENGAIYNLSGQRVSQPAQGLYIVNGKKVIIK